MPAWPASLPAWFTAHTLEPEQAFARTPFDVGPARQRRRTTAPLEGATYQVELAGELELAIFEGWYRHELKDGAEWFRAEVLNGLGRVSVDARFVEPPQKQRRPRGVWLVAMKLELRGLPVMTPQQLAPYL